MCNSGLHWKIPSKFHSVNDLLQMTAHQHNFNFNSSMKQNLSKKFCLMFFNK